MKKRIEVTAGRTIACYSTALILNMFALCKQVRIYKLRVRVARVPLWSINPTQNT
jgi:hypothetical protein